MIESFSTIRVKKHINLAQQPTDSWLIIVLYRNS